MKKELKLSNQRKKHSNLELKEQNCVWLGAILAE